MVFFATALPNAVSSLSGGGVTVPAVVSVGAVTCGVVTGGVVTGGVVTCGAVTCGVVFPGGFCPVVPPRDPIVRGGVRVPPFVPVSH
ncbi:MAG TPA: hypothetical protein VMD59_15585 [Acidimicrobiales bacterium]|nr:hypothetical protein [Acidimicrobiales bacterium]